MVTRKLFAHLGMDCLSAGIFQRGALTQMQDYAADEEGARRFAEFAAAQRATVYLVADLPEEDFRAESIPLLRGGERKALAQRKLEQLYPDTPFRYAARLPRASASERRETLLLCALSNPQPLTPWLDALTARHIPLVAIYSAAAVCAGWSRYFSSNCVLLVSWQKHAGLRLSLFIDGHLHFSRLAASGAQFPPAPTLAEEAERTRHYLASVGLLPAATPLDTRIICHRSDMAELQNALSSHSDLHYSFLDTDKLAQESGAGILAADSDITTLLLHLAATSPPPTSYAAPAHTRLFRLRQQRRWSYAVAALLAVSGISWGAVRLWQADGFNAEIHAAHAQIQNLSAQSSRHETTPLPAPAAEMKAVAALAPLLQAPSPDAIFSDLSNALEACPNVRLERLSWQTDRLKHAQTISLQISLDPAPANTRLALESVALFRIELERYGYTAQILPPANGAADAAAERFSLLVTRAMTIDAVH